VEYLDHHFAVIELGLMGQVHRRTRTALPKMGVNDIVPDCCTSDQAGTLGTPDLSKWIPMLLQTAKRHSSLLKKLKKLLSFFIRRYQISILVGETSIP
jgi:hypothetical protein